MATTTNLSNKDWEQIPGTGTAPYNPPKFRMKKEAKAKQRSAFKVKQAKKREEVTKPSVKKVYSRVTPEASAKATEAAGKRAARKYYSAGQKGIKKVTSPTTTPTVATPKTEVSQRTTPKVDIKTLAPPKGTTNVKRGTPTPRTTTKRLSPSILEAIGTPPRKKRSATEIMAEYVRQMKNKPGTRRPTSYRAGLRSKGGKVSRRKGGTVSRNSGGKVWKGGDFEVSQWYDKIKT